MARARLHPLLQQLRGAVGDLVFRDYGGRVVVSRKPAKPTGPRSDAQRQQESKLARAVPYAKAAMQDPVVRAFYVAAAKRHGGNPFSKAVGDHMVPPTVDQVDLGDYGRRTGDLIWVDASDNVGVTRVEVAVLDDDGAVLEAGEADGVGGRWRYTAEGDQPTAAAVRVRAWDRPGNQAEATAHLG